MASVEVQILLWTLVLGLVQLTVASFAAIYERGLKWALGPRDVRPAPLGTFAGRLDRAWSNFLETFALFAAAVLLCEVTGRHSAVSAAGAQVYFWARLVYVPVYALGIPVLRTAVWTFTLLGIVMVMMAAWPA